MNEVFSNLLHDTCVLTIGALGELGAQGFELVAACRDRAFHESLCLKGARGNDCVE